MKELKNILIVIVCTLLLRIGIVNIYQHFEVSGGYTLVQALRIVFYDAFNLPISLVLTPLLTHYSTKIRHISHTLGLRIASWATIVLLSSTLSTLLSAPAAGCKPLSMAWLSLFFTAIVINVVVVLAYFLWAWFRSSRTMMSNVIAKSERTQFQYTQLKRQLDPHFLFNSLNILDYLVQEQQTERASDYIKKLANIYRYLLKQEEYATIELSKEVDFVRLYIDIMRERFLDGFDVDISLSDRVLSRKVVPCALQILVENAFKHNATTPSKLHIKISSEGGGWIVVKNNLNPKHSAPSIDSGLGLKNLREQYRMVAKKEIEIEQTKEEFIVKIPLL